MAEPGRSPDPAKQRALGLIFFTMLMDIMGIALLAPVAPQIVLLYSPDAFMVTMVTMVYAGGQFLASPILGKLGDRYGRRPVLLFSILGQAVGFLIFGLGGSLGVILLGRLIGGITAGNLATATAYIADVSRRAEQAKNFALVGTAWSLGLIIGPALGGLFGQISLQTPALVAAGLALLNAVLGYFMLGRVGLLHAGRVAPARTTRSRALASTGLQPDPDDRRDGQEARSGSAAAGIRPVQPGVQRCDKHGRAFHQTSTAALFIIEKFSAVTWQVSLMLMLGGISVALTNTFAVPRLVPRLGERLAGVVSLVGLGLVYVGLYFAPFLVLVDFMYMLASSMNSFVFPVLTTLSAKRVGLREMGTLMGVTSAVGSLMNVAGPLYAGVVYDHVMPGAPFWMGALVLALAAWMLSRSSIAPAPALEELA